VQKIIKKIHLKKSLVVAKGCLTCGVAQGGANVNKLTNFVESSLFNKFTSVLNTSN
jgi:hypothetical protein